mmetsp:Transcript_22448/g.44087  ORF Transcript_22448/g.44087 Transcript_22448/m.44087 type:complete len:85 (+) Transcript_22448:1396-1650(+)
MNNAMEVPEARLEFCRRINCFAETPETFTSAFNESVHNQADLNVVNKMNLILVSLARQMNRSKEAELNSFDEQDSMQKPLLQQQ